MVILRAFRSKHFACCMIQLLKKWLLVARIDSNKPRQKVKRWEDAI